MTIFAPFLLFLALVPCDLPTSEATWGPAQHATPTIVWDAQPAEQVDAYRIYFWPADQARADTWRRVDCYTVPNIPEEYGDEAGRRVCRGDDSSVPLAVQRYIRFDPGQEVSLCVTAVRDGLESVACSNTVTICWPEERSF